MPRRARPEAVECRFGGEHVMFTARLRIQSARWSDHVRATHLARDEPARYWLGWAPEDTRPEPYPDGLDPLLVEPELLSFVGADLRTGLLLANITLMGCFDGAYDVGGLIDPTVRGEGYGTEALDAVCRLAHHHLGIVHLHAGCDADNVVSRRWLASCEFEEIGVSPYTLPDGRVTDAVWWLREDITAKRRCRNLMVA